MTDNTYDIELPDASIDDFGSITTGLTVLAVQITRAQQMGQPSALDAREVTDVMLRLVRENPEPARELLLASNEADLPAEINLPQDILDDLGLMYVDGEIVDAEDSEWENIDIE